MRFRGQASSPGPRTSSSPERPALAPRLGCRASSAPILSRTAAALCDAVRADRHHRVARQRGARFIARRHPARWRLAHSRDQVPQEPPRPAACERARRAHSLPCASPGFCRPRGLPVLSARGRRLSYSVVNKAFREIIRHADIAPGRTRRPRIHDLPHTFATRVLEQCGAGQAAIARHAVALMTYMGHSDLRYTYWYLQAPPT
jgi:integrase